MRSNVLISCLQELRPFGDGNRAVTDGILFCPTHLRKRLAMPKRCKQRIVPKAPFSLSRKTDVTVDCPFEKISSFSHSQRYDGTKPRMPVRTVAQPLQQ